PSPRAPKQRTSIVRTTSYDRHLSPPRKHPRQSTTPPSLLRPRRGVGERSRSISVFPLQLTYEIPSESIHFEIHAHLAACSSRLYSTNHLRRRRPMGNSPQRHHRKNRLIRWRRRRKDRRLHSQARRPGTIPARGGPPRRRT